MSPLESQPPARPQEFLWAPGGSLGTRFQLSAISSPISAFQNPREGFYSLLPCSRLLLTHVDSGAASASCALPETMVCAAQLSEEPISLWLPHKLIFCHELNKSNDFAAYFLMLGQE